jgi:hypothetical protein
MMRFTLAPLLPITNTPPAWSWPGFSCNRQSYLKYRIAESLQGRAVNLIKVSGDAHHAEKIERGKYEV